MIWRRLGKKRFRPAKDRLRPYLSVVIRPYYALLPCSFLAATVTWLVMPHAPATARVVITSPADEITDTRPRIAWNSKDKPGQKYDVWILPGGADHLSAPALFVAKSVTSPLRFEDMQPGTGAGLASLETGAEYQVLVCLADAGRMAGVPVPFRVKALLPP